MIKSDNLIAKNNIRALALLSTVTNIFNFVSINVNENIINYTKCSVIMVSEGKMRK